MPKLMTLGRLAAPGQSIFNPKAKFIRLKTKCTEPPELLIHEFDSDDDLDDNILPDEEDADFAEEPQDPN